MNSLFEYLIKSALWLTAFYLVYRFLLRNETLHTFNRFFLLTGLIASVVMPLVVIYRTVQIDLPISDSAAMQAAGIHVVSPQTSLSLTEIIKYIAFALYGAGIIAIMARTTSNINPLWKEIRQRTSDSNLIYSDVHTAPFSFGKYIFIPSNISKKELDLILRHESVHTSEMHYIDIWFSKIVCIMQFFNPLVWIYAKAIQDNCEFIADHRTLQSTERKDDYLQLLIKYSIQPHFNTTSLNFAFPLIIKRLKIIKQKQSSKLSSLKGLAIVPLACAIMAGYAQTRTVVNQPEVQKQSTVSSISENPAKGQKAMPAVPQTELLAQNNIAETSATQQKKKTSVDEVVVVGYGAAKNADKPASRPLTDDVFMIAEEPPQFPDGDLSAYLVRNIRYPADAMERGVCGRVICQFIVEKNGSITSVSVARSVDPFLDAEACRVIYGMPKWIPGKQRGENVRVKYTLPIEFHLE